MSIEISRSYGRTVEIQKPDRTGIWIRHDATFKTTVDALEDVKDISDNLQKMAYADVHESISSEVKKIKAAFAPKDEEPFSGKSESLSSMPQV
jgi:hypothetical protein